MFTTNKSNDIYRHRQCAMAATSKDTNVGSNITREGIVCIDFYRLDKIDFTLIYLGQFRLRCHIDVQLTTLLISVFPFIKKSSCWILAVLSRQHMSSAALVRVILYKNCRATLTDVSCL